MERMEDTFSFRFMEGDFSLGLSFYGELCENDKLNDLLESAVACRAQGRSKEAFDCLQQALKIEKRPDIYNLIGIMHFFDDEPQKAWESFHTALDMDEKYLDPYYNLGKLFTFMDEPEAQTHSVEVLDHLLECPIIQRDLLAQVCNRRAYLYFDEGEQEKAIELFKIAEFLDEDFVDPSFNLGNIYFIEQDAQKAEEYYKKALEIDDEFVEAYNGLGLVAVMNCNFDEAESYFDKALEIDESFTVAQKNKELSKERRKNVM